MCLSLPHVLVAAWHYYKTFFSSSSTRKCFSRKLCGWCAVPSCIVLFRCGRHSTPSFIVQFICQEHLFFPFLLLLFLSFVCVIENNSLQRTENKTKFITVTVIVDVFLRLKNAEMNEKKNQEENEKIWKRSRDRCLKSKEFSVIIAVTHSVSLWLWWHFNIILSLRPFRCETNTSNKHICARRRPTKENAKDLNLNWKYLI